ncbi:MAG TPA: DUF262 domain-containing protein [Candidatus Limnocylindrales bacterium]|nr:DUF262 domain-containing protein [Candidatus Limnocylindrales bacterium]
MRCVPAHHFTIAKARAWRSALEDRPPYQRESAVWSLDKQQLFIDSLLNGYDVPKIYLHDLRGSEPTKVYAIVDGKQRLTTIWSFLEDGFPLAPDFRVEPANVPGEPPEATAPRAGQRFSEFSPAWRDAFLSTFLSVVLIRGATEHDIQALFSRLNNGEPLNAAEKRNALGGDMARLVRTVAARPFFAERLHFTNARLGHFELAARLLVLAASDGKGPPDQRSAALDAFVREHRALAARERDALLRAVDDGLARMAAVFHPSDPLLASPSYAALSFEFLRALAAGEPAADRTDPWAASDPSGASGARAFLDWFGRRRHEALDLPEHERDASLVEFSGLMQHGAQDARSFARRLEILRAAWARYRAGTASTSAPRGSETAGSGAEPNSS